MFNLGTFRLDMIKFKKKKTKRLQIGLVGIGITYRIGN